MRSLRAGASGLVAACLLCAAIAAPARAKRVQAPAHTRDSPWLHESDFQSDPGLYARLGQTVILELEWRARSPRRRLVTNVLRLLLDRETNFALCIPKDARYVKSVKIRTAKGRNVGRIRRRAPCEPFRLSAGSYQIRVIHNARAVPRSGQAAFFRLAAPASPDGGLLYTIDPSGCPGCDLTGADLSGQSFPGADFSRATLAQANLDHANFQSARFDDASLVGASLNGTDLTATYVSCANLSGGALTGLFGSAREGIVYSDDGSPPRLVRVDLSTGVRTVVSGDGIGSKYFELVDVAALADGSLLTLDPFFDAGGGQAQGDSTLYRVEPNRGVATVVSNSTVGTGPAFGSVTSTRPALDGSYLVMGESPPGSGHAALFQVDPASGDRRIVSSGTIGTGPALGPLARFAVDQDGTVVAAALATTTLVRVDLATGDRSVVTGSGVGSGTTLSRVSVVLLTSDRTIVVIDAGRLVSVDPSTGDRAVLSSATMGSGPRMRFPDGLAEAEDGSLLVVDGQVPGVFRVDPATGDRTLVSSPTVGAGTEVGSPFGMAKLPVATSVAPDFSCRLDASGATLDLATLPIEFWRYMDLSGANITDAPGATLSSKDAPLDLSGAILSGVNFKGAALDFANFGCFEGTATGDAPCPAASAPRQCTMLQGTALEQVSLSGGCLAGARLEGASLADSNLARADLSGAMLLGLQPSGNAAILDGAFMADATLAGADLTGVSADHVNFYSAKATADATSATMTGARFTNAYLAGADFGGAELEGTTWTDSVLVGANFASARLEKNTVVDLATTFSGAYLQGADFTNATVSDVDFSNSYWDVTTGGQTLVIQLEQSNHAFTGYWNEPTAVECVEAGYATNSTPPLSTTMSNYCPSTLAGPCTGKWDMPATPIQEADIPSAVYPSLPAECSSVDLYWQLGGR